jgi:hypothetical protein
MKSILCLLVAVGCFSTSAAFADTRSRAITITSDAYAGSYSIDITRSATGSVTSMIYTGPNNPNGQTLTPSALGKGPVPILHMAGRDIVLLSTESDFNVQKGGHINVRFLTNGIDGNYKNFRVLIDVGSTVVLRSDPNSDDPDSDNNAYTSVFNQLFLKRNSLFGKTIGVEEIDPTEQ